MSRAVDGAVGLARRGGYWCGGAEHARVNNRYLIFPEFRGGGLIALRLARRCP